MARHPRRSVLGKVLEVSRPVGVEVSAHHILKQIELDQTLAGADHILVREPKDELPIVVHELMNKLPEFIAEHPGVEENVFTTLIRIGLNLVGRDSYVAQLPPAAVQGSLAILRKKTKGLEDLYPPFANAAVDRFLADMWSVNGRDSLLAFMADKIKEELAESHLPSRFIDAFASAARQTVYWKMADERYGKFGNDYARGLETLRHLGFCQVSTNPVLAARAFDEDPHLVQSLKKQIEANPAWRENPRAHGHAMVMAGTLLALWPNLEVFRPLAILVDNRDYMISFQLNPNVADDAKLSLDDAKRAYALAREHLAEYDQLLGVENPGEIPPNIVFKVAGSSEAARQVTRELNATGIGTNNTVTFTVSQEVRLIIDALDGKAEAIKAARPVTRTYETNMGGRFVSHLREQEAKRIILEIASQKGEDHANQAITRLAKRLNLPDQEVERANKASTLTERADIVCAYKNMKALTHEGFLETASAAGLTHEQVEQLEMDLRKAGTLVARRVYSLFYENENHEKWVKWLQRQHRLSREKALVVLDSMDILPASKRIPEDTYETLASTNMCNTEFPNHARAVQVYSEKNGFDLASYREAALRPADSDVVQRLSALRDFVQGYESTKETSAELLLVGVLAGTEDLGMGGIRVVEWSEFGSVRKTMKEFKDAYDKFLDRCIRLATG